MAEVSAVAAVPTATLAQAYEETKSEREAVVEPQHITVDVPSAVTTVYGALPALHAQRAALDACFKQFEMRWLDRLERYAAAALYAHTRWLFAAEPPVPLQDMIAEATQRRASLVSVLETASMHALIPAEILKDLQGPKGHKNMAVDLIGTAGVVRQYWGALEGKTPLTLADLERTERLAQELLKALGAREQTPVVDDASALDRKRAFTLMAQAYLELREAIKYLRRHVDDADQIAPSLYAGRGGSRRKDAPDEESQPTPQVAPVPPVPVELRPAVPVGHPDSSPFKE